MLHYFTIQITIHNYDFIILFKHWNVIQSHTLSHRKWMMSNHGIHSVSIDEVMIQILVILNICYHRFPQVHVIFTVSEKTKYHNLFFFYPWLIRLANSSLQHNILWQVLGSTRWSQHNQMYVVLPMFDSGSYRSVLYTSCDKVGQFAAGLSTPLFFII